ncbi:MAG: hypothetical protein KUA34_11295 [Pseudodesulfovibrio sp.]|nr:hypothetical protein [Pseudomonadota bacterium]MBV1765598.1 hypothetical protein [Pseudodesulfovibrio sp.]
MKWLKIFALMRDMQVRGREMLSKKQGMLRMFGHEEKRLRKKSATLTSNLGWVVDVSLSWLNRFRYSWLDLITSFISHGFDSFGCCYLHLDKNRSY